MLYLLFALLDRWFAPAPPGARVGWLKTHVFAHRGLHGPGVIENSPAAFTEAIVRGLGIECDVQRSSDGQAIVFHDWDLERLTGQTGQLIDFSAAQLGKIPLVGGDDTIPTLRQVLDLIGGHVPLLIEIKSRPDLHVVPLCLAVRRVLEGYQGHVAVMSFDPRVSRWFARYSPHTIRGLVMTEGAKRTLFAQSRRHFALWQARPQFLAYDVQDLPSRFATGLRRRGLPLLAWTVNSPEMATRAAAQADAPIAEGPGIEGLRAEGLAPA